MITNYSYEQKLLIAQVSKLKQDKIEMKGEIERLKKELKLSNLERCPHDYQFYREQYLNMYKVIQENYDSKKEIERLKMYLYNSARDNCKECPHYTVYDGLGMCIVIGDYLNDEHKKECDRGKE